MISHIKTDICVIGAGSGGLTVAAGASQLGAKVVLVEKAKMGGDCLNYGCVPSKALLAAGKHAHAFMEGASFGIAPVKPEVDFAKVNAHVHDVIATIAPLDSVERFTGLGVKVIQAAGKFLDRKRLQAGDQIITARRFVIATGSSPAIIPLPGLDTVDYFTNETIFDNQICPEHLVIIGGGPIGMEMAQAHQRLGARVTVLEKFTALGKDDPELTAHLLQRLKSEGIEILEGADITDIRNAAPGIAVTVETDGSTRQLQASHLLVAVGRSPNVDGLDLEAAGVSYSGKGIEVDRGLKTSNRRIYAIGDVAGSYQFTHVASYHASLVIRSALFRLPAKVDESAIPWVTYTDPELAHVGLTQAQAEEKFSTIRVLRWSFEENDRATAERSRDGLVKAVIGKRGRILGATIVGKNAGELIQPWILAISKGLKISALAGMIAPYPTLGEVNKRAAGAYYTETLFSPRTQKLVRLLSHFG